MAYISIRSEKSISELADKVYSNLSAANRRAAEEALVKENPALKDIRKLKRGTLIRIPDIKNIKRKNTRSVADPDSELLEEYVEQLKAFSTSLEKNHDTRNKEQKATQAVLKKSNITKLINTNPDAKKVAAGLKKHVDEDIKNRKQVLSDYKQAFKSLKKDLDKLLK